MFFFGWGILWHNFLGYYWHSNVYKVYQVDDLVRFCNQEDSFELAWKASKNNEALMNDVIIEARNGVPVTIVGRGFFYELNNSKELYFDEIYSTKSGSNPDCEAINANLL